MDENPQIQSNYQNQMKSAKTINITFSPLPNPQENIENKQK